MQVHVNIRSQRSRMPAVWAIPLQSERGKGAIQKGCEMRWRMEVMQAEAQSNAVAACLCRSTGAQEQAALLHVSLREPARRGRRTVRIGWFARILTG